MYHTPTPPSQGAPSLQSGRYCMYLRKSRADLEKEQLGQYETLARHERELTEVCQRAGIVVDGVYRELVSGESIAARTEFQALMQLVSQRQVTGIVVHAIDRLGRGDMMEYGWVLSVLQFTNTFIVTPGKTYDPNDPGDLLALQMMMIISNGEYANIKRRFREGREASAREGQYIGSVAPYGYDKVDIDRKHTLRPNAKADVVRGIYESKAAGDTCGDIARRLNASGITTATGRMWSYHIVRNLISNPVYKGLIRRNRRQVVVESREGFEFRKRISINPDPDIYKGLHEAIVDEALWEAANAVKRTGEPRVRGELVLRNPLAGILFCAKCGRTVRLTETCTRTKHRQHRYTHPSFTPCEAFKSCKMDVVLEVLADSLAELASDLEVRVDEGSALADRLAAERKALMLEVEAGERKVDKLIDLFTAEALTVSEFRSRRAATDELLERARARVAEIDATELPDPVAVSVGVREVLALLGDEGVGAKVKNDALKAVISRVEMENLSKVNGVDDIKLEIFLR